MIPYLKKYFNLFRNINSEKCPVNYVKNLFYIFYQHHGLKYFKLYVLMVNYFNKSLQKQDKIEWIYICEKIFRKSNKILLEQILYINNHF